MLLAAEGMAGTTVRAVCAHARLNPRYFYESFADLDDLLVSVYDDVWCQLRRRTDDSLAGLHDEGAAVRASVAATVSFIAEDRRRGCVLYSEALGNEALKVRRIEAGMAFVNLVQRDRSSCDGEGHDERIGRLGAAVTVGGFSELLVAWLDGRVELSVEELIDAATEVFLAVWDATRRLQGPVKLNPGGVHERVMTANASEERALLSVATSAASGPGRSRRHSPQPIGSSACLDGDV